MIIKLRDWINNIYRKLGFKGAMSSLIFMTIIIVFSVLLTKNVPIRFIQGQESKIDIRAINQIEDTNATQDRIQSVVQQVEPVYRISPTVGIISKDRVSDYFSLIRDEKLNNERAISEKLKLIQEESPITLDDNTNTLVLNLEFREINYLESIIIDISTQFLAGGIKDEDLQIVLDSLDESVGTLNIEDNSRIIVVNILKEIIQSNEFIDVIGTERRITEAKESVQPVLVLPGDIIVRQGDIFDAYTISLLNEAGVEEDTTGRVIAFYMGLISFLIFSFTLLISYSLKFNHSVLKDNNLLLLYAILLTSIALNYIISLFSIYLMPLSLAGILISVLLNPIIGIISSIFIASVLMITTNIPLGVVLLSIISMSIVFIQISPSSQRMQLLIKGSYIGSLKLVLFLSFIGFGFNFTDDILMDSLFLILSGLISGIFALGSLPMWENVFKILTPLKLMELSNPNEPVLKRLQIEAPGTYQHSLMVGNLSEASAQRIGANSLLAKVASYYHDIGKLKRPIYFKENQFNTDNPHDDMEPLQSLEVITSHREDGLKLGKDYKLHKDIIDIIDQHHGTTLMAYFYHQATKDGVNLPETKFRYQGMKPQSKEAGIVMLSDSVEAAVRSIKDIDDEKIKLMVKNVIKTKVDDGQLDESYLTLNDLKAIESEFIDVFKRIYHGRIEYPKLNEK